MSDLNLIPSVSPEIRQFFACLRLVLPLRISIIRSMILHAFIRPSLISLLSYSFLRRVVYFLVLISYWNSTLYLIMSLSPRTSGLPSAIVSILTPKVSSNLVFLYKRCSSFLTSAFFFSSSTILMPSLEDSLEISVISCVFFVSIRSTTSDINLPIPVPIIV